MEESIKTIIKGLHPGRWTGTSVDHLAGKGDFTKTEDQATDLPQTVLEDIKAATKTALLQMLNGATPSIDIMNIHQRPDESFIKFVDYLTQAIDKQNTQRPEKNCLQNWLLLMLIIAARTFCTLFPRPKANCHSDG